MNVNVCVGVSCVFFSALKLTIVDYFYSFNLAVIYLFMHTYILPQCDVFALNKDCT